ncbi:hypothetical protein L218DRAFT_919088 [Marasmius fiardii PR-910]|nr:hypothetical protein L218DRAFT_919088 [Marasmius fiardii PR-910]
MRSALLLSLASICLAFERSSNSEDDFDSVHRTPRIAIIGAGAGGSSAAFWVTKAKERFGVDVAVDVYEKASYIGGRSITVQPFDDPSLPPVEIGASIFVEANRNLMRATQFFNLSLQGFGGEDGDSGIWDGEKLRSSTYDKNSPVIAGSIAGSMVQSYLSLYSHDAPKWDSITSLATTIGLLNFTASSTANFYQSRGVDANFLYEVIESATRINYGQNADKLHALGGTASIAATGASQVVGGNYKIYEHFLNYSQAVVNLNTRVTRITPGSSSSSPWFVHTDRGSTAYKSVILAAPLHQTNIEFPHSIASKVPEQPYVHLHVTLFTTTSPTVNPEYLSLPPATQIPPTLLTTYQGVREGGKAPEFNSLNYLGKIKEDEWIVKIFSQESISDEWLNNVFSGQVGWVHRKEWDAYPELIPTTTFPPVKLGTGFYYVNALEPFLSTMDSETVAARNVVDLLLNEGFNSSICGPSSAPGNQPEDFVYGWDC